MAGKGKQESDGAAGVHVRLYGPDGQLAGQATTDADGRVRRLLESPLRAGDYRIEFELDAAFFRRAVLTFRVEDTSRSCHVPLLLAPYSLASYRGS
jgi:5-hydroxyisourate hydrolase-like protein (transthyretin family)